MHRHPFYSEVPREGMSRDTGNVTVMCLVLRSVRIR